VSAVAQHFTSFVDFQNYEDDDEANKSDTERK
jgi:hypothetical protein